MVLKFTLTCREFFFWWVRVHAKHKGQYNTTAEGGPTESRTKFIKGLGL